MVTNVHFTPREIELAIRAKSLGLVWEPKVGNFVHDTQAVVQPTSPFQDRVYFILNHDYFMKKIGGVGRFKEVMTWLPTWEDLRQELGARGISGEQIAARVAASGAWAAGNEREVLYQWWVELLEQAAGG